MFLSRILAHIADIRSRWQMPFKRCTLPDFYKAVLSGPGIPNQIIPASAVAALMEHGGPSMWFGYDAAKPLGAAQDGKIWFGVYMLLKNHPYAVAKIIVTRNGLRRFIYYFERTDIFTDVNGEHRGEHPCAVIEVTHAFIDDWLVRQTELVEA